MTACRDVRELLDDYVDGTLAGESGAGAAEHLAGCPACAGEEAALRSLLAKASALPDSLEPGRDLWPGIEARIRGKRPQRNAERPRHRTVPARWAAAAAAACVLAGFAVALLVLRPRANGGPASLDAAPPSVEWAAVKASEPEYGRARAQLLAALRAREGQLSPETRRVVHENLAIMDKAIGEMKSALEKDPGNRGLAVLIEGLYRQEIDLLMQVAQSTEKI